MSKKVIYVDIKMATLTKQVLYLIFF